MASSCHRQTVTKQCRKAAACVELFQVFVTEYGGDDRGYVTSKRAWRMRSIRIEHPYTAGIIAVNSACS